MTMQFGQLSIPSTSNLRFLPLMYILPEHIIRKCPVMSKLPRKLREILYDMDVREIVESDQFLREIMDAFAYVVFPHFGFRGWKEDYSGYCPIWELTYALPVWLNCLSELINWNLNTLIQIPSTQEIPFFLPEHINNVMHRIVRKGLDDYDLQPILDVVREIPCIEDFEIRNSRVKIDFLRSWYHIRSKIGVMISFEEVKKDGDEDYYSNVPADSHNTADYIASKDYCHRFKHLLSDKDLSILEMRELGYTVEEIAKNLGYKNHSGVVKRIQAIKKEFIKYQSEQQ